MKINFFIQIIMFSITSFLSAGVINADDRWHYLLESKKLTYYYDEKTISYDSANNNFTAWVKLIPKDTIWYKSIEEKIRKKRKNDDEEKKDIKISEKFLAYKLIQYKIECKKNTFSTLMIVDYYSDDSKEETAIKKPKSETIIPESTEEALKTEICK